LRNKGEEAAAASLAAADRDLGREILIDGNQKSHATNHRLDGAKTL